ncbi:hypothetical protein BKA70DRAFT_840582 [Coprinopsis sp. MPI-PUGE-AT-0042]|nr:hypothetical protein BKA70DRAFT_840582 [Coprinopsis sp. MPI-PUGE-AT-0042]
MSFLNLPVDILIHILCVLDATDIVSMRQACKTLASIENTLYSTIWKSCTQGLCLEAPLFPPTLKWRLPPSKLHEIIARRASRFKCVLSLVASQGNASTAPLPRLNTELSAPPSWPNVPIGKVILVPGGRFLIILGESQPIQVYDLASYYVDGTAPVLIANFTLSHKFAVVHAAACTLAGPEASCVRLLLHEFINRSEATGFDLADDEAALRLVLYELRFERDTPCLACVGSLPMTYGRFRSPSIGAFFRLLDLRSAHRLRLDWDCSCLGFCLKYSRYLVAPTGAPFAGGCHRGQALWRSLLHVCVPLGRRIRFVHHLQLASNVPSLPR